MEYILILSIILNIILFYVCYNLYNKNISYEDIILSIQKEIANTVNLMRQIDYSGAFEADDEVGSTFKSLLNILNKLEGIINVKEETE